MNKPAARPRPTGGFHQGIGHFNEHLDENAMQQAVQQKALGQQGTTSTPAPMQQSAGGLPGLPGQPGMPGATAEPRAVGTVQEELVTRPVQDIKKELLAFVDINALLGIHPEQDDPQTQAQKKALHTRWQKLNQEQKDLATKKYQEEMQKKQAQQQQEEEERARAAQAQRDSLVVPSSPKKGPVGPGGTGKKAAVAQLEQDRKTLSGPKSAN